MLDKFIDLTKPFADSVKYPKEYNPRVHGAYNPAINYGKSEPLSQVKIGELGSWLSRRNFSFANIRAVSSRAMWQYRMKYLIPKKANGAVIFHIVAIAFTLNYFLWEYPVRKNHKWAIYH